MTTPEATNSPTFSPIPGRVKVIDKLGTLGPSSPASLIAVSEHEVRLRVQRSIQVGSTVHVRAGELIVFGHVRASVPTETGFDIDVNI